MKKFYVLLFLMESTGPEFQGVFFDRDVAEKVITHYSAFFAHKKINWNKLERDSADFLDFFKDHNASEPTHIYQSESKNWALLHYTDSK